MRSALDKLYSWLGRAAALSILGICALIFTQVVLNIIARLAGVGFAYSIPSYAEISGYLLSAASFLALADTLTSGVHIRVSLLTDRLSPSAHWLFELAALFIGSIMAILMAKAGIGLWLQTLKFGDKSSGMLAIPLAIPQAFMVIGLVVFAVAFLDLLIQTLRAKRAILTNHGSE